MAEAKLKHASTGEICPKSEFNGGSDKFFDPHQDLGEYLTDNGRNRTYKRGKLLGIGGFARVYEMTDIKTDEIFAAKIVPKFRLTKRGHREKMMREIQLQEHMDHPNVVKYHNYFEDEKYLYIMLEFCSRRSLFQALRKKQRLSEEEVRFFMLQIAEGVRYIHEEHSVVHRDLKLGNLLFSSDLNLKIADFGLAARVEEGGETHATTVCGTPNYIAPEVLSMQGHGFPADVWSMGCILYALLVGQPPFESSTLRETYARINNNLYKMPKFVSLPARRLINIMLQTSPELRPNASEVLLHEFFTGVSPPNEIPIQTSGQRSVGVVTNNRSAPEVSKAPKRIRYLSTSLPILNLCCQMENTFRIEEGEAKMGSIKPIGQARHKSSLCKRLASIFSRRRKPKSHPLLRIQKKLDVYLSKELKENSAYHGKTLDDDFLFVSKWMDFTNKYGFGYLLSDGCVGVIYNDGCCLTTSPNNKYLEFIPRSGERTSVLRQEIPDLLESRLTLLEHFSHYMEENLVEGATLSQPTKWKRKTSSHLQSWYRTNRSIMLYLSNGTVQVNFSDHTKIVLDSSSGTRILYIDRDKNISFFTLKNIKKRGCQVSLHNRLKQAAIVLESFIERDV